MIILRLNGGLGNQMFQYAYGKFLSSKYNRQLYIDDSQFQGSNRKYSLDLFSLVLPYSNEINLVTKSEYNIFLLEEDQFNFDEDATHVLDGHELTKSIFLISGYWQSYKYFSSILPLLKKDFRFTYKINYSYIEIQEKIQNTESIMIHIRRGDYLQSGNLEKHGTVNTNYIEKAMSFYKNKISNAHFFIFSDDPEWCIANIPHSRNVIFIERDSDEGKTSFSLMRQCKYFIISNSTFSWWAAWLSEHPKKHVICPQEWFKVSDIDTSDLIPSDWDRY